MSPTRIDDPVLGQLVRHSPLAIVVSTLSEGHILDVNESFLRLFGYTCEEVIGQTSSGLGMWVDPGQRSRLIAAITAEQPLRDFEATVRTKSGAERHVLATVSPIEIDGRRLLLTQLYDVTERNAAEAARQEAEARYSTLFQHSLDAVLLTAPDGRILDANPEACRLFDRTVEEIRKVGRAGLVDPADPRLTAALAERARTGRFRGELTMRRRNGESFPAEVATQVFTGPGDHRWTSMTIHDLTVQRRAEAALSESEERFRSAFDHAPIGIALVAPDGRFLQVNQALCEVVGYTPEELKGKTFQAITHPDDLAGDLELAARLWAGQIDTYQLEKRYLHKDGHEVWVLLTGSAVRSGAAPRYGIAQIVDITERRRLESERAEMLATEREYSRRLRELTAMRADLTAMIAHELRAPVSALRMMTFLLRTGKLSAQEETAMSDNIDDEIARLDRLINDVADVTAAEREDFAVHPQPGPLATLFEDAAGYARTTLRDHPFSVAPAPDVWVRCDRERVTQVLRNLLDNAAKHTPVGTAVELRARREGSRVRVEVVDQGPGLAPEDATVIFEKFGRGGNAAARRLPGAGLGLYLSRRILLAHQSDLHVESAPGQGTVFSFDLEIVP